MDNRKRITVRVSRDLHRRVKIGCAYDEAQVNTVIVALLERAFPATKPPKKVKATGQIEEAA